MDARLPPATAELPQLAHAWRHVASPRFHDRIAALPVARVLDALEGFASPALAAKLLDSLESRPPRLIARVAHTLGGDAAGSLLAFAKDAPRAHRCRLARADDRDALRGQALALFAAGRPDLAGASVHLAGRFADRAEIVRKIRPRGGLVIDGPFGKVDYVLVGDDVDPEELAKLTSLGAIPLSP